MSTGEFISLLLVVAVILIAIIKTAPPTDKRK